MSRRQASHSPPNKQMSTRQPSTAETTRTRKLGGGGGVESVNATLPRPNSGQLTEHTLRTSSGYSASEAMIDLSGITPDTSASSAVFTGRW